MPIERNMPAHAVRGERSRRPHCGGERSAVVGDLSRSRSWTHTGTRWHGAGDRCRADSTSTWRMPGRACGRRRSLMADGDCRLPGRCSPGEGAQAVGVTNQREKEQ
jgi:hypothetical protein